MTDTLRQILKHANSMLWAYFGPYVPTEHIPMAVTRHLPLTLVQKLKVESQQSLILWLTSQSDWLGLTAYRDFRQTTARFKGAVKLSQSQVTSAISCKLSSFNFFTTHPQWKLCDAIFFWGTVASRHMVVNISQLKFTRKIFNPWCNPY